MNDDLSTLKQIADLAHSGGLAGLSQAEALVAICRLTLPYWDKARPINQMTFDVVAALRLSKTSF
jgi:hypothetical protein